LTSYIFEQVFSFSLLQNSFNNPYCFSCWKYAYFSLLLNNIRLSQALPTVNPNILWNFYQYCLLLLVSYWINFYLYRTSEFRARIHLGSIFSSHRDTDPGSVFQMQILDLDPIVQFWFFHYCRYRPLQVQIFFLC